MGKVGRWGLSRLSRKSTTFINAAAILNLLTPSNKAKYAGFDKCGFTQINGDALLSAKCPQYDERYKSNI